MRATLRLGRVSGIDLGAHWSVLVIGALLAFGLTGGVVDAQLWAVVVPTVAIFLGCLLAHELGHSVVAQRNGVRVRGITLWMLGGVAQLDDRIPSAGATFRITIAGPAVSYALAAAFFGVYGVVNAIGAPNLVVQAVGWLALVNVVLGTFNLIPAAPLDGGRILASAIWGVTGDRTRAEVGATRVGQAFGGLLIVGGLLGPAVGVPYVSLWTAIMGLFVLQTATAEQRYAWQAGLVGDALVRDVMTTEPQTIRGWQTVQSARGELARPAATVRAPRARVGRIDRRDRDARAARPGPRGGPRLPAGPGRRRADDARRHRGTDRAVADGGVAAPRGSPGVVVVFDAGELVGVVTPADLHRAARRTVTV